MTEKDMPDIKRKKKDKLFSSKLWVTVWAIVMVTFIVITDRQSFSGIANWLCSVPLAYIGCNVWQKQIYSKKDGPSCQA